MRSRWASRSVALLLFVYSAARATPLLGDVILRDGVFRPTEQAAKIIETPYYEATIVPEAGGRILSLRDQRTRTELLSINSAGRHSVWGGLLDDKNGREFMPYSFDVIEHDATHLNVRLSLRQGDLKQTVVKELSFRSDNPGIGVKYTYINEGQETMVWNATAVRNCVFPVIDDDPRQSTFLVPTRRAVRDLGPPAPPPPGFPEFRGKIMRELGAPWHAVLHRQKRLGLTFIHQDDGYGGFYSWRGRSHEWFQKPVPAGHQAAYELMVVLTDGFESLVDANPEYLIDVHQAPSDPGRLTLSVRVGSIGPAHRGMTVKLWLEDFKGNVATTMPETTFENLPTGGSAEKQTSTTALEKGFYVLKGVVSGDGGILGRFEDILSVDAGRYTEGPYRRAKYSVPTAELDKVPGWTARKTELAQPDATDTDRGYMVYVHTGESPGAMLKRYSLQLVRGEYESFRVVYYPLKDDIGMVSWGASNLREAGDGTPRDVYPEMRIESEEQQSALMSGRLNPKNLLKLTPNSRFMGDRKRHLWLTIATQTLEPGPYEFDLHVQPDTGQHIRIPMHVTVRDIMMPDQLVSFEVEAYFFGLATANRREREAYFGDLERHQVDFLQESGAVGYHPGDRDSIRVRGHNMSLAQFVKQNLTNDQGRLENTFLDLSCYDACVHDAIRHGLIRFKTAYYDTQVPQGYRLWSYGELYRYMREKGYPADSLFIKVLDEQPLDKYPLMARVANEFGKTGWIPFSTFDTLLGLPDQLKILSPHYHMYQCGGVTDPEIVAQRIEEGILKDTDEIWEYNALTSINSYDLLASQAWRIGYNNLHGFHNHEYLRGGGTRLGSFVIFPTPVGPLSSPAWEGLRDAIDNAILYRHAQHLIRAAGEQRLADGSERDRWEQLLAEIVGHGERTIIRLVKRDVGHGLRSGRLENYTAENGIRARRALLDLLEHMLGRIGPRLRYSLRWGRVPLVEQGNLTHDVSHGRTTSADALRPLIERISTASPGLEVVAPGGIDRNRSLVIAGTFADPDIQNILQSDPRFAKRYDAGYPAPGNYAVIEVRDPWTDGQSAIVILGGDADGVALGVSNFTHFLKKEL